MVKPPERGAGPGTRFAEECTGASAFEGGHLFPLTFHRKDTICLDTTKPAVIKAARSKMTTATVNAAVKKGRAINVARANMTKATSATTRTVGSVIREWADAIAMKMISMVAINTAVASSAVAATTGQVAVRVKVGSMVEAVSKDSMAATKVVKAAATKAIRGAIPATIPVARSTPRVARMIGIDPVADRAVALAAPVLVRVRAGPTIRVGSVVTPRAGVIRTTTMPIITNGAQSRWTR